MLIISNINETDKNSDKTITKGGIKKDQADENISKLKNDYELNSTKPYSINKLNTKSNNISNNSQNYDNTSIKQQASLNKIKQTKSKTHSKVNSLDLTNNRIDKSYSKLNNMNKSRIGDNNIIKVPGNYGIDFSQAMDQILREKKLNKVYKQNRKIEEAKKMLCSFEIRTKDKMISSYENAIFNAKESDKNSCNNKSFRSLINKAQRSNSQISKGNTCQNIQYKNKTSSRKMFRQNSCFVLG